MLAALPLDPTATLREQDFRSLHSIYATWRGRVPAAMPRSVHVSAELLANPERIPCGAGLWAVVREIAEGADLRPRMSTAIGCAYVYEPPPLLARRRRGRQHDLLLADWGIHHLHLSPGHGPNSPEFVGRTGRVLFTAFVGCDAYLIDLRPHESDGANWSELAILETVVRNWPEAGIVQSSEYVLGLKGGNWTDDQRKALRAAGISGGVEIDGRVWSPGGQSLMGTPGRVERHCMATSWFLSGFEPTEDRLRDQLSAMALKHGVPDDWHGHVDGDDVGFLSAGGVFVRYGSLLPR